MNYEVYYEHNFVMQEAIHDAQNSKKEVVIAWLDLTNAFPSIPHDSIHKDLEAHGLPDKTRRIIKSLYDNLTTQVRTTAGYTDPIRIISRVRQGCPLSPIIFNLTLEPVLRSVQRKGQGYLLANQKISNLTYADDIPSWLTRLKECERFLKQQSKWLPLLDSHSTLKNVHLYI